MFIQICRRITHAFSEKCAFVIDEFFSPNLKPLDPKQCLLGSTSNLVALKLDVTFAVMHLRFV